MAGQKQDDSSIHICERMTRIQEYENPFWKGKFSGKLVRFLFFGRK